MTHANIALYRRKYGNHDQQRMLQATEVVHWVVQRAVTDIFHCHSLRQHTKLECKWHQLVSNNPCKSIGLTKLHNFIENNKVVA